MRFFTKNITKVKNSNLNLRFKIRFLPKISIRVKNLDPELAIQKNTDKIVSRVFLNSFSPSDYISELYFPSSLSIIKLVDFGCPAL